MPARSQKPTKDDRIPPKKLLMALDGLRSWLDDNGRIPTLREKSMKERSPEEVRELSDRLIRRLQRGVLITKLLGISNGD